MFQMIHDIVYYGKGGFDWETVYNMPIWLRKFTYQRIADAIRQQNEAQESAVSTGKGGTTRQIDFAKPPPDIKPGQRI